MSKYIVTDKGPIDRRQPGEDVTGVYDAATLQRLVDDGYVALDEPAPKRKSKKAVSDAD